MNVYIEVTYFMNAILILLCFEILSFLLNIQITIKKLCLYVFTYNISIVFLFVDLFTGFLLVYDFILTFFYFRRLIYIYYPVYLFIYFSILLNYFILIFINLDKFTRIYTNFHYFSIFYFLFNIYIV